MSEEEHKEEQDHDNPCANLDFLCLAGEEFDCYVGDETEGDTVRDIVGERHHCHCEERPE